MKRPTTQRLEGVEGAIYRIPVPPQLVDEALATFLSTGELPDDPRVAMQVANRIQDRTPPGVCGSTFDWAKAVRDYMEKGEREKDLVREALFEEAIWATGLVRSGARSMLHGLVVAGFDLREPNFAGVPLPEFGGVGLYMLDFPLRFVGPQYAEQCERLVLRCDVLARAIPHDDRVWRRAMHTASELFQSYGERPADRLVLECVLALGEMDTFVRLISGRQVDQELAAFDAAFMTTGEDRERAIERLQTMAAAGRFAAEVR